MVATFLIKHWKSFALVGFVLAIYFYGKHQAKVECENKLLNLRVEQQALIREAEESTREEFLKQIEQEMERSKKFQRSIKQLQEKERRLIAQLVDIPTLEIVKEVPSECPQVNPFGSDFVKLWNNAATDTPLPGTDPAP